MLELPTFEKRSGQEVEETAHNIVRTPATLGSEINHNRWRKGKGQEQGDEGRVGDPVNCVKKRPEDWDIMLS